MKLYFIRHGQTDWNVQKKIQGSSDIELNETGIKQAGKLSYTFIKQNLFFSKIYTSPQKRALKTAEILGADTNTQCIPIPALAEMNLGDWEGLSWPVVAETYPEIYAKWHQNRRYISTPNGESYQQVIERIMPALYQIISENTENVVIVTHSAIMMSLQCYLAGLPFEKMTQFRNDNTSIVTIDSEQIIEMKKYA